MTYLAFWEEMQPLDHDKALVQVGMCDGFYEICCTYEEQEAHPLCRNMSGPVGSQA